MQLYAVNFIPLLGPLYMFRVFSIPIIRNTIFNFIYSHWYKPHYRLSYLLPVWPGSTRVYKTPETCRVDLAVEYN